MNLILTTHSFCVNRFDVAYTELCPTDLSGTRRSPANFLENNRWTVIMLVAQMSTHCLCARSFLILEPKLEMSSSTSSLREFKKFSILIELTTRIVPFRSSDSLNILVQIRLYHSSTVLQAQPCGLPVPFCCFRDTAVSILHCGGKYVPPFEGTSSETWSSGEQLSLRLWIYISDDA